MKTKSQLMSLSRFTEASINKLLQRGEGGNINRRAHILGITNAVYAIQQRFLDSRGLLFQYQSCLS